MIKLILRLLQVEVLAICKKSGPKVNDQRLRTMDELEPERRISIGLQRGAQPLADCADERILWTSGGSASPDRAHTKGLHDTGCHHICYAHKQSAQASLTCTGLGSKPMDLRRHRER